MRILERELRLEQRDLVLALGLAIKDSGVVVVVLGSELGLSDHTSNAKDENATENDVGFIARPAK